MLLTTTDTLLQFTEFDSTGSLTLNLQDIALFKSDPDYVRYVQAITAPNLYTDTATQKKNLALPFSLSYHDKTGNMIFTEVGLCVVDDSKKVRSQIIASTTWPDYIDAASFALSNFGSGENYLSELQINYRGSLQESAQKIDATSLAKIGEAFLFPHRDYGRDWEQPKIFTLSNGAKISMKFTQSYQVDLPKLRDLTPAEITSNQDLTSGSQSTDPSLKKSIVAFQPDVSASLEISPNPNSCLAVIGCDSNPSAKMSFPVNHHSQISLYSSTDRDYTLDQLLNGEFDFSAAMPLPISRPVNRRKLSAEEEDRILTDPRSDPKLVEAIWTRGLGGEKAVDDLLASSKRSLAAANFTNSTDDDYSYGYYGDGADDDTIDEAEIDLENLKSPYTIILLPNNQTVILVGVNATEVAKTPEVYFLTQDQLTVSPSGQPSKQPAGKPSSEPSKQPIGYPTSHPSAGDLIMPTGGPSGQPSLKPFANPSAVPSYKPQAIPSFNPSGKPSSPPTEEPSIKPSKQSKLPTNQPSLSKDDLDIPTAKPVFNPNSRSPSSAQPSALQTEFSTSYAPSNLRISEPTAAGSLAPTATNTIGFGDDSKPASIVAPVAGGVAALLGVLGIAAVYKYCKGAKANKTVHPKSEKEGFAEIVGKNGDDSASR